MTPAQGEIDMTLSGEQEAGPRYLQLGNLLQKRIEEGFYTVGDLLPTENELCEEFNVSRYTVREALRRLIEAGLVRRRQGSGSQIVATRAPENYVHSMRSLSELFQYASDTVLKISETKLAVPDPAFAPLLGEHANAPWLQVEGVRLDSDGKTPICFSLVFINEAFAEIAPLLKGQTGAVYSLIEARFGVTVADVEQEITAEPISRSAARALATSSRIWTVRVVRRYIGADGRLLLVSVNYHPGDRFSYSMHLRREGAKGWV
jgi:GntR family transcriptional regulator